MEQGFRARVWPCAGRLEMRRLVRKSMSVRLLLLAGCCLVPLPGTSCFPAFHTKAWFAQYTSSHASSRNMRDGKPKFRCRDCSCKKFAKSSGLQRTGIALSRIPPTELPPTTFLISEGASRA